MYFLVPYILIWGVKAQVVPNCFPILSAGVFPSKRSGFKLFGPVPLGPSSYFWRENVPAWKEIWSINLIKNA